VLVASVACLGVLSAVAIRQVAMARRCGDAADRLAPAWSTEQRTAVEAVHSPALVQEVDAFAQQWSARYEAVCPILAADEMIARDEPLPTRSSPQTACLADARDELQAIVEVLALAPADEGPRLVQALPVLTDCDEREAVGAAEVVEPLARAAPILARARALAAMGRLEPAQATLDTLSPEWLASASVAGRAHELRAGIAALAGQPVEADAQAALALGYAEQGRERELAVRAWLHLYAAARARGEHERAQLCAERADSLAVRVAPASLRAAASRARGDAGP
jgi:hypothetical protein